MIIFSIIAAADDNNGIGISGGLPWNLPGDLKHYRDITVGKPPPGKQNAVIMGRNTWLSLPEKFRPFPSRLNVVLNNTSELAVPDGVLLAVSFDDALAKLATRSDINEVFVVGGASIYAQAIVRPECARIYLTRVEGKFACDTYFPAIDPHRFRLVKESAVQQDGVVKYRFQEYVRGVNYV